jgi:hypothetical protein
MSNRSELTDVHKYANPLLLDEPTMLRRISTLMRAYRSVPSAWYLSLLTLNFGAAGMCGSSLALGTPTDTKAVILVKTTPLQMPVWALMLSMAIAAVCTVLHSVA